MYKLVLFDLDGTLLDSDKVIEFTFRKLYEIYSPERNPSSEYFYQFSGPQIILSLKKEFPDYDTKLMLAEWNKYSKENYDKYAKPYPFVLEMLAKLKQKQIKFGIITSKNRNATDYAFKLTGLDKYVEFSICADEVKETKPSPEGVLLALKKMKIENKNEVIYVGDNMYDFLTAKNAGVKFGYVTFSPRKLGKDCKPDLLIDSFEHFVEEIEYEKD